MNAKNKQNMYIMAAVVFLTIVMLMLHRAAISHGIFTDYGIEPDLYGQCEVPGNENPSKHQTLDPIHQGF